MLTYAEKNIIQEDILLFREIEKIIREVSFPSLGIYDSFDGREIDITCHVIVDALARIFPSLIVERGYYITGFEHSWLITQNGNYIDAYPFGTIGSPLLIARQMVSRRGPIYIPREDVEYTYPLYDNYLSAVDMIEESLRRLM